MLLDYESEAIAAQKAGDAVQYVIPKQTILIQTPIAVTEQELAPRRRRRSSTGCGRRPGQTIWAQQGYRPVIASVAKKFASKFPTPPQLFTIDFLGGWTKVEDQFFDPSTGSITKIEQAAGFPLPPASAVASRCRAGARRRAPRRSGAAAAGSDWAAHALPERDRPDPARRGVAKASSQGFSTFWDSVTSREASRRSELTLLASLIVAAIGAVMGTLVAWVLVRDQFPASGSSTR